MINEENYMIHTSAVSHCAVVVLK